MDSTLYYSFLFKFSVCVGCLLLGLTEVYLIHSCLTALCKILNTELCGITPCDLLIPDIFYLDIPMAESFKQKQTDYHHVNEIISLCMFS